MTQKLVKIDLKGYVKHRNGVPLGAPGSLKNMLLRSFGAGSLGDFWKFWNPVWGYYLARYIMKPLNRHVPHWMAIIGTFLVSGLIHDLAVMLIEFRWQFVITPWFLLISVLLVISGALQLNYRRYHLVVRGSINAGQIAACFWLAQLIFS